MLKLREDRERTLYLICEWETEVGLPARIHWCEWNKNLDFNPDFIFDFFTGYVRLDNGAVFPDAESVIDVHGGVTYNDQMGFEGAEGTWIGFDMCHSWDSKETQNLKYAIAECEKMAKQIKKNESN